ITGTPAVTGRIPIFGQPNRLLMNKAQDRMYVAVDNSDTVAVIDLAQNKQLSWFSVVAPPSILAGDGLPRGANPNRPGLSPDERTLYVTDGGTNTIAVASLRLDGSGEVTGMIPTAWYPNSVSISADGKTLYAVNGKSLPGPNPGNCRGDARAPKIPDCKKQAE